jgi:hypothetical protein
MKIFGQVLDIDGLPMGLANVTIVSGEFANKMADEADLDGNFVIEDNSITPDSEFKISYVGYKPQFFKAKELQGKKIKLLDDNIVLDEVVINSGKKPKDNRPVAVESSKNKFVQHLQDHKIIYAGIGMLAGLFLIVRAFKNKK